MMIIHVIVIGGKKSQIFTFEHTWASLQTRILIGSGLSSTIIASLNLLDCFSDHLTEVLPQVHVKDVSPSSTESVLIDQTYLVPSFPSSVHACELGHQSVKVLLFPLCAVNFRVVDDATRHQGLL